MRKTEIFDIVLAKASELCEIPESAILGTSKFQPVVEARILAVQYLRRIGFTPDEIALIVMRKQSGDMEHLPPIKELKMKARNISQLFDSYSQRCLESYAFCLISAEMKQFCREKYSEYYMSWMKELPPVK